MRLRALAQALQAAGGSQLAASLRVEQQPAASAAWHLQCRGAAAAAAEPGSGVGEQPAAAEPAVAPAAPSAKPQPKAKQQASKPPPGKQQAAGKAKAAGKQPAGQQPAGKPAAANAAGKPAGEPYSKPQPKQAAPRCVVVWRGAVSLMRPQPATCPQFAPRRPPAAPPVLQPIVHNHLRRVLTARRAPAAPRPPSAAAC